MAIKDMPLAFRIELHRELVIHAIVPTCLNCEYTDRAPRRLSTPKPGDEQPVVCEKYNAKVPIQIVVVGCPDWRQGVPF